MDNNDHEFDLFSVCLKCLALSNITAKCKYYILNECKDFNIS